MEKSKNFKQKTNFILNKICNGNLDEFTKLFHIKNGKTSFKNRRTYLKATWLTIEITPRNFKKEYSKYPFSNLTYNGKLLFKNPEEFLNIDLKTFEEKINDYIEYKSILIIPKCLDYRYLYVYNKYRTQENKHIDYYQIEHINRKENQVEISVTHSKNKLLEIEPYEGKLRYENNKIILNFSNKNDYVTAIFNTEINDDFNNYLTGVAIGIADINKKIPTAKKVVLSKIAITNIDKLYLTLNESETISAEEDYYIIKDNNIDFKKNHLEKYAKKIDNLNSFFKNLRELKYFNSFYEHLAFKEFSSVNNVFQKIKDNHSYYTSCRQKVLEILINSYYTQKYTTVNIVMPVYQSDNIFEHQTEYALNIQKRFRELSKKVSINIIFVINNCTNPFSKEFKKFLTQIQSSTNISIIHKKDIEYEVNSIDFIFTSKNDFVISKSLRVDMSFFQLYLHKNIIDNYHSFFKKIIIRSIKYKEFIKNKDKICTKTNSLLKSLSGKWYHYIYGSKQFWENEIYIFENGKVEYYCKDRKVERGEILIKEYQSVILLDDPISKRLFTMVFDNQLYKIQKAFFTKIIVKQLETDLDMFSIGILSRKPIPLDKALEILGDVNEVRLLEKIEMSKRLTNYLIDIS